ncbi:MAG TPA: hypothetical protein VGY57_08650, partial [Vicinamibacterales bacterium]|nr:hypothetical protein [Vicinamibacterales bacterium]
MATAAVCLTVASAAAAQTNASEDIPVPGGTLAMARALGISPAPDRPRFLAELVRVLYDTPEGVNNEADGRIAKLTAYVNAVGRFQEALASTRADASGFSLKMAETGDAGRFNQFLDLAGLRIRGKSQPLRVEPSSDKRAAERARQLADVAIDVADLAKQLNAGGTVRIDLPAETAPVPLSSAIWSGALLRRPVSPSMLFAAVVSDRRAAMLSIGLAALDDETIRYLGENPAILLRLYEEHSASFAAFGEALRIRGGRVAPPGGAQG